MPSVRRVRLALGLPFPRLAARRDDPLGDHVHRRVEVEALPVACRAAPGTGRDCSRASPVVSCSVAEPFGHSRPRLIGESGSPSIWTTVSSLT